jgi:hypothetical protein
MEATITDRLIGIEIETVCPVVGHGDNYEIQRLVADILTQQGLPSHARSYSHQPVPAGCVFCVEADSSLQGETRFQGIRWAHLELKNRPMTFAEVEQALPLALEILSYLGCRVNASTAVHVHHDFSQVVHRPETARNLAHLFHRFQRVLFGCVAPSRASSHYCKPLQQSDATRFDSVRSYADLCREVARCDRFRALNFTNVSNRDRMTVEYRLHGGTLDWQKLRAWVLATQRWTEHAVTRSCHHREEPIPNTRAGLNALLVSTGLKVNSRIYKKVDPQLRQAGRMLVKRWWHFNKPLPFKAAA